MPFWGAAADAALAGAPPPPAPRARAASLADALAVVIGGSSGAGENSSRGRTPTSARAASAAAATTEASAVRAVSDALAAGALRAAPRDVELAAWLAEWAADVAEATFYARGAQPLMDFPRLTVDAADSGAIEDAQRGDEDEKIRFQRHRADAGDVEAALSAASLLYWGGRGLARDQVAARH
jgi:hypothetical protein